jgi:hypothetical protein
VTGSGSSVLNVGAALGLGSVVFLGLPSLLAENSTARILGNPLPSNSSQYQLFTGLQLKSVRLLIVKPCSRKLKILAVS